MGRLILFAIVFAILAAFAASFFSRRTKDDDDDNDGSNVFNGDPDNVRRLSDHRPSDEDE